MDTACASTPKNDNVTLDHDPQYELSITVPVQFIDQVKVIMASSSLFAAHVTVHAKPKQDDAKNAFSVKIDETSFCSFNEFLGGIGYCVHEVTMHIKKQPRVPQRYKCSLCIAESDFHCFKNILERNSFVVRDVTVHAYPKTQEPGMGVTATMQENLLNMYKDVIDGLGLHVRYIVAHINHKPECVCEKRK